MRDKRKKRVYTCEESAAGCMAIVHLKKECKRPKKGCMGNEQALVSLSQNSTANVKGGCTKAVIIEGG